jgi:L-lactate dehydrogenase complex protein LldG
MVKVPEKSFLCREAIPSVMGGKGSKMSSREQILARLRSREKPFPQADPPATYQPMTPMAGDESGLLARFIGEAEALNAVVHQPLDEALAIQVILDILGTDKIILAWDWSSIPLPGLPAALESAHVTVASPHDSEVRVGISGASAALAATGSLVLCSGKGQYRATSLLPPVHIAVITRHQILPNLEGWIEQQRAAGLPAFQQTSNTVIVSGPSRTADIAMELILGMHGPGELHIIIL